MSDPPLSDIDFKNKMAWVWSYFIEVPLTSSSSQPIGDIDVGDRQNVLVTVLAISVWHQNPKDVTNIYKLSPTSTNPMSNRHQHYCHRFWRRPMKFQSLEWTQNQKGTAGPRTPDHEKSLPTLLNFEMSSLTHRFQFEVLLTHRNIRHVTIFRKCLGHKMSHF